MRYKKHLNSKCPYLFQRPKRKVTVSEPVWYDAAPLGHNALGSMMPQISVSAQLSSRFTNHSLRPTAVYILDTAQFASHHIMSITGHN